MNLLFALVSFLGAFLLFWIQPLSGKVLLPLFGGTFMVWVVALSFFQGLLLLGYAAIHFFSGTTISKRHLIAVFILGGAFFFTQRPTFVASPDYSHLVTGVLLSLGYNLFFPFFVLTLNSVMLQKAWAQVHVPTVGHHGTFTAEQDEPYFLYSASNAGSLAGLLGFPLFLEPLFPLSAQWLAWKIGVLLWLVAWGGLLAYASRFVGTPEAKSDENGFADLPQPEEPATFGSWALAAAASSLVLIAVTTIITQDIAVSPLLWTLPLATYLVSYMVAFERRETSGVWWLESFHLFLAFGFGLSLLNQLGFALGALTRIALHLLLLYAIATACHAALAFSRPRTATRLSSFYLAIAFGGWVGSGIAAFLMPLICKSLLELPLGLFLAAWAIWGDHPFKRQVPDLFFPIRAMGIFGILFLLPAIANQAMPLSGGFVITAATGAILYAFLVLREAIRLQKNRVLTALLLFLALAGVDWFGGSGLILHVSRNYYGIFRVFEQDSLRYLQMGSTYHGHESRDVSSLGRPLMYYHPETTIGGFLEKASDTWKHMGVLGLGAGTLAAFARPDQHIDFYELDPECVRIARTWFSFLPNAAGTIRVFTGDGRLGLRAAASGSYDLLLMDAFNSDAIPVHLLTVQAIGEYAGKLKPDGLILFHISNRHVNLAPILFANARVASLEARLGQVTELRNSLALPTRWVAMGSPAGLARFATALSGWESKGADDWFHRLTPWTDDYSNILTSLSFDEFLGEAP